jgi:NADPH-dependent 2,4-dienoyl-CoA reductase/sulfur reductase-like enzyme
MLDDGQSVGSRSGLGLAPGGVLVNEGTMQSVTRKNVFAAGDCATVMQESSCIRDGSNWFQMRLWTQAVHCGKAAGRNMAAWLRGERALEGEAFELFAHSTRFFGRKVVLLGLYNAQGLTSGFKIFEGGGANGDDVFIRVVIEGNKLRGAILIGDTELSETYENLILDGLHVGHLGAELVDPSIDLADYFD